MTAITRATREVVLDRDQYACVSCGRSIYTFNSYSVHHRIPRGMGGSKDPKLSLPSNLITLCGSGTTGCHGWSESHRIDARMWGYLLWNLSVPSMIAVFTHTGWTFYQDDGTVSYPDPPLLPDDRLRELAREVELARRQRMHEAS